MKIKNVNNKYWIPPKETFHNFIFNAILLAITLWLGYSLIPGILQKNSFERIKEQDYQEKRNEFIKEFIYLGQRRIYLAERYFKNIKANEDKILLDRSWDEYMESVITWNSTNLLNPIFIAYYYNDTAKDDFYNKLQKKLVQLHEGLLELRDGKGPDTIKGEELIESAKNELFLFSEKMFFGVYR